MNAQPQHYRLTPRRLMEPMLACKQPKELSRAEYITEILMRHMLLYSQPKIDGIRCLIVNGMPVSRKFLPIPNNHIRKTICDARLPEGLDGELVTYTNGARDSFNDIQSKVMSEDGQPEFEFLIFDYAQPLYLDVSFESRYGLNLPSNLPSFCRSFVGEMHTITCTNELESVERLYIDEQKHEGIMLRVPHAPYKCGRATLREGYLIAIKTFEDSEALVLDSFEQMYNDNGRDTDAFGRTKRSKSKGGMTPANMLGGFIVKDINTGITFEISTGFTKQERQLLWLQRAQQIGKILTYRYQAYGQKDKPRGASFKGWRKD